MHFKKDISSTKMGRHYCTRIADTFTLGDHASDHQQNRVNSVSQLRQNKMEKALTAK